MFPKISVLTRSICCMYLALSTTKILFIAISCELLLTSAGSSKLFLRCHRSHPDLIAIPTKNHRQLSRILSFEFINIARCWERRKRHSAC
ncbi:uncharacterized protein F5147DRAFT_704971 [Suillus discolor]|uniref:Uncharacterized protein n=1 Tax=Suillus discolor TaxID=1912936 RepID=A0A9P7JS60_9AGAM|nr:uncharacterized protein F5147DRAFT_704971 [Suillus discolor]KAG2104081.1 hypothetical protein F5147DRAFT_704971 [Suillus discolor]